MSREKRVRRGGVVFVGARPGWEADARAPTAVDAVDRPHHGFVTRGDFTKDTHIFAKTRDAGS